LTFEGDGIPDKRNRVNAGLYFVVTCVMNIVAYPAIIAWTVAGIIFFPFGFPLWKVLTGWEGDRIMRHFVWIYGRGWLGIMLPFVRFRREGFSNNRIDLPSIIVINHLSFFDTYCMALLPVSNIAFTIRSWPFKMPWYAPFMRLANYLDLEAIGWEGTFEAGSRILSKGGSLLFFPEGHRSRDGQIQRFYSGPFKLAVETGAPIVPLCIIGTDRLLPPNRWWFLPSRVCLRVLTPVSPKEFTGETAHVDLRKHVKNLMTENLEEMRKTWE
jgi:1-acyl-sn-glycerol-3-phosphate acyltransferase